MLAEAAKPGDGAFFIRGEQLAIKWRLRIIYFHFRRRSDGPARADFRRGDELRQRFLQTANKGIFKRRKDLIHFTTAGQHAARRQQNAVIKALTGHLR